MPSRTARALVRLWLATPAVDSTNWSTSAGPDSPLPLRGVAFLGEALSVIVMFATVPTRPEPPGSARWPRTDAAANSEGHRHCAVDAPSSPNVHRCAPCTCQNRYG